MERRKFLEWFVKVCSALITGLLALPVVSFLFEKTTPETGSNWYPLLKLNPEEKAGVNQARIRKVVRDGWLQDVQEQYVWIIKKQDGSYLVLNSHCTHLGCLVSWDDGSKKFRCPCHGGVFDETGNRVAGPPPRPLDRYATKVENNTLFIKV
jgi:menaquinol-cytochrome c reductase iron-sulfur subunit